MPDDAIEAPRSVIAAVFLLARQLLPEWCGWPRTVDEVLALVDAGKSQAYDKLDELKAVLPALSGRPGRPVSRPIETRIIIPVLRAVLDYLLNVLFGAGERRTYTDDFRRFIVGLAAPGRPAEGMSTGDLASATGVPLGTLKDWLHPQQADVQKPDSPPPPTPTPPAAADTSDPSSIRAAHLQEVATLWKSWEGSFQAFCQMVRTGCRLPYGDTTIGDFLQSVGLRQRHPHAPVEAPWSSGTFRTFFPGFQWLGDGTDIGIRWGDQSYVFNLEALLDVASDRLVGFAISDAEDEAALRLAYEAGIATTGSPPLALTLDNKPCNHSPGAVEATANTTLLRATPARGQAKAPLEGTFGRLQQGLPPLIISGETPREMARNALKLIVAAWVSGRNGKPRKRLNGLSPDEAYAGARPTPDEIQEALAWIRELQRRQERARLTREARRDPVRLELLARGLAELGIPDPDQRLAVALAGYAREAIARGLSTFRTKQEFGTLPADADHGRYLGGIIRNLHTRMELERISVHLLEQRLRLRDLTLAPLEITARQLRSTEAPSAIPQAFVDRALDAAYEVDFRYWGQAAAEALSALPAGQRVALYRSLSLRIAASFKTDRKRREDLIDRLAEAVASAAA